MRGSSRMRGASWAVGRMAESGARILVIDDEPQIRKFIRLSLAAHGFELSEAATGADGIARAMSFHPDLVILDLGLPDIAGMDVLRTIRAWSRIPIIVLTVIDRESSKIDALDGGADDYVTKPFGMGELLARIRVALRHLGNTQTDPILQFGHLIIDLAQRNVEVNGEKIRLTPTEYELLKVLATNAGRVLTQRQLVQQVWGGYEYDTENQNLRVFIGHLRKKIEPDPARPTFIVTEPGIGYRFAAQD